MNEKKHCQGQIIYVTSQDGKDVVFVIVILILQKLLVHVALRDLGPNHEVRENGNNDDILWNMYLEATPSGT